ncbi:KTSC domain-containing protein [Paenibacillus sp. FSL R7-0313]|uniref:KTSC domain-containing protein n=1 Tax=Paenibacillus sp. FSL R7-0313 TaxID=2954532 RepID=UPI0030DB7124
MDRKYVESSMITNIGYDESQAILEVEFKSNGHVWQYYDVPEYIWFEMNSAPSVGKYFHANIKNTYSESRVG